MTDIFYWTGLVAIFAIAFIASQMAEPEQTFKPIPVKTQYLIN